MTKVYLKSNTYSNGYLSSSMANGDNYKYESTTAKADPWKVFFKHGVKEDVGMIGDIQSGDLVLFQSVANNLWLASN